MFETLVLQKVGKLGCGAHHLDRVAEIDGPVQGIERAVDVVLFECDEGGVVLDEDLVGSQRERARSTRYAAGRLAQAAVIERQLHPGARVFRVHANTPLRELCRVTIVFFGFGAPRLDLV